jgi:hypothetical protein
MKKLVLLLVILPLFGLGQTSKNAIHNYSESTAPASKAQLKFVTDYAPKAISVVEPRQAPEYKKISSRGSKYSPIEIGNSQYGLQTNASVGRRIVVYPDGKKSAVWTTSSNVNPFTLRGTGYNHYDGTSWLHSIQTRLEVTRAGWPNIGKFNNKGTDVEYIMSHYSSSVATDPSGGIIINVNGGIGQTTSWQQTFLDQASGPIWHRTAETGKYVHIISTYSDTMKYIDSVRAPTVYSRYDIVNKKFKEQYVLLPGYDTTLFKLGRGDDYAIDAKGATVAIVLAPYFGHVVLWKSIDSGATFKKIMIDSLDIPMPKFEGDTQFFYVPDGSVSVIIDNEDFCKVVWSYYKCTKSTTADSTSFMYYKFLHGLRYWDEKKDTILNIPTAKVWDRNGDGILNIGSAIANEEKRTVNNTNYLYDDYGLTNPLLSFPQITIDNDNNIFVIYSAIVEDAFYLEYAEENLRDVYVVYSKDHGLTWGPQQNISNNPLMEDVFGSVSKNCYDNKLHIIFQEDEDPGTDVQNFDPGTINLEYYVSVPISDILNNLVGLGDSITNPGFAEQLKSFEIGNNYPNPFSGETFVDIKLSNNSNVTVTLNNMLGQQVLENTYTNVPGGKRTLSIDASGLQKGVYFLNVKVGNEVKTVKAIIQ